MVDSVLQLLAFGQCANCPLFFRGHLWRQITSVGHVLSLLSLRSLICLSLLKSKFFILTMVCSDYNKNVNSLNYLVAGIFWLSWSDWQPFITGKLICLYRVKKKNRMSVSVRVCCFEMRFLLSTLLILV